MVPHLKLHWEGEHGWILDTVTLLSPAHIKYVVDKTLPIQLQRWRGLKPGNEKEALGQAIELLKQYKISQWLIEGHAPFQSTQRTTQKQTFYME